MLSWRSLFGIWVAIVTIVGGTAAEASGAANRSSRAALFTSSRSLLLNQAALPHHFAYRGYFVQYSVAKWDGGIKPIMAIDERYGWMEAAEERARDPRGYDVMLSVQLFRSSPGAKADFSHFFSNQHPVTIYQPGATWLGGSSLRGFGDRSVIYRVSDDSSRCPDHLTTGLTLVFRNAIFSVGLCLETSGESVARELARRMLSRAQHLRG